MPLNETLNARPVTLGELLSNGRRYAIPAFQRDYAWSEREWAELWDDLIILHERRAERVEHYLGAIVLQATGQESEQRIVDGQQRLVTLSVLALAVIAHVEQLAADGVEPEDNAERASLLRGRFINIRSAASLEYSPRLSLNEHDNAFYRAYLVRGRRPRWPRTLRQSERRLLEALDFFRARLAERFGGSRSGAEVAAFLSDVVAARVRFIQIDVEDDETAFTVFETLNARGVALGTGDLLKNFLFQTAAAGGQSDLEAARGLWARTVALVPMEQLPQMMFHRLAARVPGLRPKRVFSAVKQIVGEGDVFEFLQDMRETAEIYAALDDPLAAVWRDFEGARREIRHLRVIGIEQVRPLVLAALPRFAERRERWANLLRRLVALGVRWVVTEADMGMVERACQAAAIRVERGELKSPRAMVRALGEAHVDDAQFEFAFARLALSPQGPRKALVRYLLSELEVAYGGRPIGFERGDASIEHVLPQNPGEGFEAFSAAQHRDALDRLGNLTPLEGMLNRQLGSVAYEAKREIYAESGFAITRVITAPEWTPEALHARQEEMAAKALSIWSLGDAIEAR